MTAINKWLTACAASWQCDFIGVALDEKSQSIKEIRWVYVAGAKNLAYQKIRLKIGRGIAGEVWKTGRLQKDNNLQKNPEKLMAYPISRSEKLDSVMAVPVFNPEAFSEVLAVLLIGYRQPKEFSTVEEAQLTNAARQLAELLKEGAVNE